MPKNLLLVGAGRRPTMKVTLLSNCNGNSFALGTDAACANGLFAGEVGLVCSIPFTKVDP